jgi:hypothetical protein
MQNPSIQTQSVQTHRAQPKSNPVNPSQKRNRNRSQRRAIFCPIHGCPIDSVSQKYSLFADHVQQLQDRGISKRHASLLLSDRTTVSLTGEWVENFWCDHCQKTEWYHVKRSTVLGKSQSQYDVSLVSPEVWQHVTGVMDVHGNPSVSAFTLRHSRMMQSNSISDFAFVNA